MKNLYFLSLLSLSFLFIACSSDDEPETQTVEWVLDGANIQNINSINSGENTKIVLVLASNSLCPNSGVRVVVTASGEEQYNELIETFTFNLEITVSKDEDVEISTAIEDIPNSPVVCITLGEVNCSLTY